MSSQSKAIQNIQHIEKAFAGVFACLLFIARICSKSAVAFCAMREKHCYSMIADIHEAVRYSESQGVRSEATKQATHKRLCQLQAEAKRWAKRQQAWSRQG